MHAVVSATDLPRLVRCIVWYRILWSASSLLVEWVEDHVEETLTVYRLPREHRLRMKSTNMLERYNEELRRRTRVVRIFPNAESCLRLILALAAETHERWLTGQRYLYGRIGVVRASEPESETWQEAA